MPGDNALLRQPAQAHARVAIMKRADEDEENAMHQFEKIVRDQPHAFASFGEAIRAREECSHTKAMSRAADQHPALLKRYRREGIELVRKAADDAEPPGRPKAERTFSDKVAEVAGARGISRTAAMSVVRREYPDLYRALQRVGP